MEKTSGGLLLADEKKRGGLFDAWRKGMWTPWGKLTANATLRLPANR